jgi:hypothetical protein
LVYFADIDGHGPMLSFSRSLKNAHLRRFPHPSSLRRTAKYASGRLINSPAWQESLLIRRDATLRISGAPANGISQSSTCICLPAEALAQAGAFLSNLGKVTFSASCWVLSAGGKGKAIREEQAVMELKPRGFYFMVDCRDQ